MCTFNRYAEHQHSSQTLPYTSQADSLELTYISEGGVFLLIPKTSLLLLISANQLPKVAPEPRGWVGNSFISHFHPSAPLSIKACMQIEAPVQLEAESLINPSVSNLLSEKQNLLFLPYRT